MICFPVTESSQVGAIRRQATHLAQNAGFDPTGVGDVGLIATEFATNLVKHATRGHLFMRVFDVDGGNGLELLSLDHGPGMAEAARCLNDGYSTPGNPGTGLGAIRRIASQFDIHSQEGHGTVAVARIFTEGASGTTVSVGVVHQALPGESMCGDAWLVQSYDGGLLCVVVDGLGHGPLAATAAREILDSLAKPLSTKNTVHLIELAHYAAKATVGAALGVAMLDYDAQVVRFAGVGNISAAVLQGGGRQHLISYDGVVGKAYRKAQEFTIPWSNESVLVMHSDGIGTRWHAEQYSGLLRRDPSLLAGMLYRDFARAYDDATIVVLAAP